MPGRGTSSCGSVPMESALLARLKILRGSRYERFDVPFEAGQTVLDGLRWIRVHRDPSLAIRFSCINANACKECMIQVDGKTVYACTTRLADGEMTLEPLPNKVLIKDLVTEIAPPDER
jgi:succinate dehydrogenase/fumarate reductase-like Fe-S protein